MNQNRQFEDVIGALDAARENLGAARSLVLVSFLAHPLKLLYK
jgi:hypothetical protein